MSNKVHIDCNIYNKFTINHIKGTWRLIDELTNEIDEIKKEKTIFIMRIEYLYFSKTLVSLQILSDEYNQIIETIEHLKIQLDMEYKRL